MVPLYEMAAVPGTEPGRSAEDWAAGPKLAAASKANRETPRLWTTGPYGTTIDAFVFSSAERASKPDPGMYRLAPGPLGPRASECASAGEGGSQEPTVTSAARLSAILYRVPGRSTVEKYRHDPDTSWAGPAEGNRTPCRESSPGFGIAVSGWRARRPTHTPKPPARSPQPCRSKRAGPRLGARRP